jgi:signal transduction histidine kinase
MNDYKIKSREIIEEDIAIMNSAALRTQALLDNLLQWARSSTGTIVYAPARNDFIKIADNCVNFLQAQASIKNITIKLPDINSECYVDCDANMILTVLRNLLSNAIKFSFRDSSIEINVTDFASDSNYVQVSVKDSGVGIPSKDINKLFNTMVSTEGTNQETGTGLGLILCKEFIDKHNCNIWADSPKGEGITFSFTLPKAQ